MTIGGKANENDRRDDTDTDTDADTDSEAEDWSCTRIVSAWGSVESPKATGIASSGIAKIATRN